MSQVGGAVVLKSPEATSARFRSVAPFSPANADKMLREMFGTPVNAIHVPDGMYSRNIQPDDLMRNYVNREMVMASQLVTAAVLNARNNVLITSIAPLVETLEQTFTFTDTQPNATPWTTVANFGMPREVTYKTFKTSYTIERAKQMVRIELNLLLDPNYGMEEWTRSTTTLATNATLTLVLDAAFQMVDQPFRNLIYDWDNERPVHQNQVFLAEQEAFGASAWDQDSFYRMLVSPKQGQVPFKFDTILMPVGTTSKLAGLAAPGRNIPSEALEPGDDVRSMQRAIIAGPRSAGVLYSDGRDIDIVELGDLHVNPHDGSGVLLRPLQHTVTYGEVIVMKDTSPTEPAIYQAGADLLDVFACRQTATDMRWARIEFVKALRHNGLFDADGQPAYDAFVSSMNASGRIPAPWVNGNDIDNEEGYGVEEFSAAMVDGKSSLREMTEFREDFAFVTYDPKRGIFRIPGHVGDLHRFNYSNESVRRGAEMVLKHVNIPNTFNDELNEIVDVITAMDRELWTEDYVKELIDTNAKFHRDGGERGLDSVAQMVGNEFGTLRLPKMGNQPNIPNTYPPGFASYAGLRTLAKEADSVASFWRNAGKTARDILRNFENIFSGIKQAFPESEIVQASNRAPWFVVDDGGRSVLFDTLVQLATGRQSPKSVELFLGEADPGTQAAFSGDQRSLREFNTAEDLKKAAESGEDLDRWTTLASRVPTNDFASYKAVVLRIESFDEGGDKLPLPGRPDETISANTAKNSMVAALEKLMGQDDYRKVVGPRLRALALSASDDNKGKNNDTVFFQDFIVAMQAKISYDKSFSPIYDEKKRASALADKRTADLPKSGWVRAPLTSSPQLRRTVLKSARETGNVRVTEAGDGSSSSGTASLVSSLPFAVHGQFAARSGARYSGASDAMDIDEPMGEYAAQSKLLHQSLFGAPADVRDYAPSGSKSVEENYLPFEFFGPWRSRIEWIETNVKEPVHRLACLAILFSRWNLRTHEALARYGVNIIRHDYWRTGIQCDMSSIVRIQRGSGTVFTALSRISVRPTLEGVSGDYALTGEFFHGMVWPNRKRIDIIMNAIFSGFHGGKDIDFVSEPKHLTMHATQAPSIIVMPDSVEAYRSDFPRHMFNDDYLYKHDRDKAAPYRKHTYGHFAAFILGNAYQQYDLFQRNNASYWRALPRNLIGNRAPAYYCNSPNRIFNLPVNGTGGGGDFEKNTGSAYKVWNGMAQSFPDRSIIPAFVG